MEKMKELYQKVAGDAGLQEKFKGVINNADKAGQEETEKELLSFAKEAGYDVTIDEMHEFFKGLTEQENAELTEMELDMVAGGKSTKDWGAIAGGTIGAASIVAGLTGAGLLVSVGCVAVAGVVEGSTSA